TGVGVHGRSENGNDGVVGEAHAANRSGVYGFTTDPNGCGGCFANYGGGKSAALGVTGNALQERTGGGIVKAMAYIDPFGSNKIVRCYNSQISDGRFVSTPPCGFTFYYAGLGDYVLDLGFYIFDRFMSASGTYSGFQTPVVVTAEPNGPNNPNQVFINVMYA